MTPKKSKTTQKSTHQPGSSDHALPKNFRFEKSLTQLEEILDQMESGDLELEDSIKQYEKGIQLVGDCQKYLDQIEDRIETLSNPSESR